MNKIKILAIVGKSGAGKDHILKCLKMCPIDKVNYIVSSTTRPPREGEVDGVHYHFLQHPEQVFNGQRIYTGRGEAGVYLHK